MRNKAPTHNPLPTRKAGLIGAASAIAFAVSAPVAAQQSSGTFSLPPTSPTPTPAPQGPADTRAGVQIGPRAIRTDAPAPTPTATATPRATATPTPTPAPTTRAPQTGTTAAQPETSATPRSTTATRPATDNSATPESGTAQPAPQIENAIPTDPATQSGSEDFAPSASDTSTAPSSTGDTAPQLPSVVDATDEASSLPWAWIGGLAALVLLLLGGFLWWRRRSEHVVVPADLVANTEPVGAASASPAPLPRIELEIVSASRSLMMFSLEYRLTFSNRTDRAVRDLQVSAHLASADRSGGQQNGAAAGQPVGTIERIGPHQSRTMAGSMQIPIADIRAFLQGRKPIFIPLLHLTLESAGQEPLTRSFIVGTPSAASQGRLHPIPLDTPPGGLPGLKAREISLAA